jgi:hypothetical protein
MQQRQALTTRVYLSSAGQWSFAILDGDLEVAGGGGFDSYDDALEVAQEVVQWVP